MPRTRGEGRVEERISLFFARRGLQGRGKAPSSPREVARAGVGWACRTTRDFSEGYFPPLKQLLRSPPPSLSVLEKIKEGKKNFLLLERLDNFLFGLLRINFLLQYVFLN